MTPEEEKLFAELSRRGVHVSPNLLKEQSDFDASAGTTSVSPASPPSGLADYSPSGRGNPAESPNIPPRTMLGASATPPLDDLARQLQQQFEHPLGLNPATSQERSWVDTYRPS